MFLFFFLFLQDAEFRGVGIGLSCLKDSKTEAWAAHNVLRFKANGREGRLLYPPAEGRLTRENAGRLDLQGRLRGVDGKGKIWMWNSSKDIGVVIQEL